MDAAYNIDVDMLLSFSEDLLNSLKDEKDLKNLTSCFEQSEALQSSCDSSYNETLSSIQDYHKKINACKQQTEKTKSDIVDDSEISSLERVLADAEKRGQSLGEELRVIVDEITELEQQRMSVEERKKKLQRAGQDEKRDAALLSFYACITNIIPDLNQKSKISGHIVDRDTKAVQHFVLDEENQTAFDACNKLWKTIDM